MPRGSSGSSRREALIAAVRRGLGRVLLLALLGAAVGVGLAVYRADTHTATATVLVNPLQGNPFNPDGNGDELINLESEAHLVTSDAVIDRVAGETQVDAGQLSSGVTATVPPNTQIIVVEFTSESRDEAEVVAQAFAEQFLTFRTSRATTMKDQKRSEIQSQIEAENEKLRDLVGRRSDAPSKVDRALLTEEIEGVSSQVSLLRSQLVQLETVSLDPGQVVTPAAVADASALTGAVIFGLVGALAGALAALLIIITRLRAENRIHHVDDALASGLPLLGMVEESDIDQMVKALEEPGQEPAVPSSIMQLGVSLLTRETRRPITVLMAAASDERPPTRSAMGMAMGLSKTGMNVAIVDTIGEIPAPNWAPGEHDQGLMDVLSGRVGVSDAQRRISDTLTLLPVGKDALHASDLMMGPRMRTLCDALLEDNVVVIIAAGVMSHVNTQAAASAADSIVVEAVQGETRLGDLTLLTDDGSLFGDRMLGVVLLRRARAWRLRPRRRDHVSPTPRRPSRKTDGA